MKHLIKSLLVGLLVFTIFYLLGAFYSVSFNIKDWNEVCKVFVTCFGGLCSMFATLISFINGKEYI